MEHHLGKEILGVGQPPAALGQIRKMPFGVQSEVELGFLFKFAHLLLVVAGHPAGQGVAQRLVGGVDPVLVLEPGHGHLELEHAHRPEDVIVADNRPEHLHRAFLGHLQQPFLQLLHLQRVAQHHPAEMFGREVGDAGELEFFLVAEGVADFDGAVVVDANDVAGIGLVHMRALLGHEHGGVAQVHLFAQAMVHDLHSPGELARADAEKGDPVAVGRVHVRLDFEGEAAEGLFLGMHHAGDGGARAGWGREFDKGVEHLAHAEVVDGAAEKDRGLASFEILLVVKGVGCAVQEINILAQFFGGKYAHQAAQLGIIEVVDHDAILGPGVLAGGEQGDLFAVEVVDALEALAHADWPGKRHALDLEFFLDVGQEVQRLHALAVQLVDEGDDRGIAHPTDLHQLGGLGFDALGAVDDHQGGVHGGQHPVGVFGEVLMAGGIQQVDFVVAVIEFHHRGGHRDAALLFNRHPVASGVDRRLARFDCPRHLNGAAEQQQLFGEGGLAGVGMADDAEGAALLYFFEVLTAHVF